jgi:hypothetical protein
MKEPESDCPLGDASRWLKNRAERLGERYTGPEPEPFSPANRQEEDRNLHQVLFGRRAPRTAFERRYLHFMGGIREQPLKKRVTCVKCNAEFEANGYPGTNGSPSRYPTRCEACASIKYQGSSAPPKREPARVHNDY